MNAVQGLGALALALLSGGTGWMLHTPDAAPSAPAATAAAPAESSAQHLSVLSWPRPAEEPAAEARMPAQAGCAPAAGVANAAPAEARAERLAQALREGSEQQRYDSLLQARTDGAPPSEAQLMRLMAEGPSERVRLMAFDNYIEALSGDVDALRTGLQAVLRIPHTALQAKAREQLDGIEQLYQQSAALTQQRAP